MNDVSRETRELLKTSLFDLGLSPTEKQIDCFMKYMSLLLEWNEVKNITAITNERDIVLKHFIDSLGIVRGMSLNHQKTIDIGTGAGFPGIPLKIMFPDLTITLADSSKGKIEIISKICQALGIDDYETIAENAENIGQNQNYRESFDICLSRAVASLNILLEYCAPLVKTGGVIGFYKGPNYQEEVENSQTALDLMQCRIKEYIDFSLPFLNEKRTIILVEKIGITPAKYPRRAGIPRKRPL